MESEGDRADLHIPSLDDVVEIPVPIYTVEASEGDPANPYYPSASIVQGFGSSYCPSTKNGGTLGAQVDTTPNTGFCYVATYHNFAETAVDFGWLYNSNGTLAVGQRGTIIRRNYTWGKDKKYPLLDCALIQLSTQSQQNIAPGLYQGANTPTVSVRGTNFATSGMIVKKYGMTTGLTYGRVIGLPADIDKSYANYLFAVELCDSNGYPMSGSFSNPGDSGAPVVDMNGYVLGLVVQALSFSGGTLGLINRIDQVQAALDVTIHAG
ncbi:MAG: hypothetical protein Q9170_003919 [Blastenia crenularia]